ncbi:MAG: hypothetical protein E6Q73_16215 [Pseudorhodobacter sp.]|nr:MAG: hypothetical protein E6Q73_16215 [Pseudorhodobacter sp.]
MKRLHPNPDNVINLSIGAATTAMGLYRMLNHPDLPQNAVVLWEYALNEVNYCARRQPAPVILQHTAWLFELCARRGYPVLPVLLYNQSEAVGVQKSAYRPLLDALLTRYRLGRVDAQALWKSGFKHLAADQLYKDEPHYATTTDFLSALATNVLDQLHLARVPSLKGGVSEFASWTLELVRPTVTATAQPMMFSNRAISCEMFPLQNDLQLQAHGRLLASYMISSAYEPPISFVSESGTRGPYSTQINPRAKEPQRQLKHLLLWSPRQEPLNVGKNLQISIQPRPIVQYTMSWRTPPKDHAHGGFIGVLMERPLR